MNYPDWTDYDSGAMSPEERASAERLLAEDEGARKDYAAFKEFRTTLRQAVLEEGSRSERIEAMLRDLGARRRPRFRIAWIGGLAAAVLALALLGPRLWTVPDKVGSAVENIDRIARLETSDPDEAHRWVNQQVGFRVPEYRLTQVARITGAECGKNWGAYTYNCGEKKAKLIVRPKGYKLRNARKTQVGNTTFWENENSVAWECPSCNYQIVGCDSKTRWTLAKAAATELFGKL